jgi:hypothetical protein
MDNWVWDTSENKFHNLQTDELIDEDTFFELWNA